MTNELITLVEEQLNKATGHLNMISSAPSLESHNSICAFPDSLLTVSVNDGKAVICTAVFASQFTPKTAKQICEVVTNGKNEHPVIMSPIEYYTKLVTKYTETLNVLKGL